MTMKIVELLRSLLLVATLLVTSTSVLANEAVILTEFEVGVDGQQEQVLQLEINKGIGTPAADTAADLEPEARGRDPDELTSEIPSPKPKHHEEEDSLVPARETPDDDNGEDLPLVIPTKDDCRDLEEECEFWSSIGECDAENGNPAFMYQYCPKSCNLCGRDDIADLIQQALNSVQVKVVDEPICQDLNEKCALWESIGECEAVDGNPAYMYINCQKSCNLCGKGDIDILLRRALKLRSDDLAISGWGEEQNTLNDEAFNDLKNDIDGYMLEEINVEVKYKSYKKRCRNRYKECLFWAFKGECESNPDFMEMQCAPSCKTCHKISFNYKCPMPENIPEVNAWQPGDLDKMFERIVATIPNVNIHSRPSPVESEDGPWVLTIDKFLSDAECERLIELGHSQGYKRSADVGKMNFDGTFESSVNDGRTSTNAWCVDDCVNDQQTQIVLEKIENLTGISDMYSENLQLLRYEPGQYYNTHHDYIPQDIERPQGVRILTVFLYLNEPEAGGGTNFPDLFGGITVNPKKGTVLLWPSVLNTDPNEKDGRTMHQALPVEKGLKFGANAWVHMRDFKTPHLINCT